MEVCLLGLVGGRQVGCAGTLVGGDLRAGAGFHKESRCPVECEGRVKKDRGINAGVVLLVTGGKDAGGTGNGGTGVGIRALKGGAKDIGQPE